MAAVEPVIAISDLTRRFGTRAALSSVTLQIPRGGVYGLVGANGEPDLSEGKFFGFKGTLERV